MLDTSKDPRLVPIIIQNSNRIVDEMHMPFVTAVFYGVYLDVLLCYVAGIGDTESTRRFLFGREHRSA